MPRVPLTTLACLCLAVSAAVWPALAGAERADRDQPMNIQSDSLRYDDKTQTGIFTGNVVLTKGTIVMRGARLQVHQDAQGRQFGAMQGEPGKRAFFRQKREGLDEYIEGESQAIEYDGETDTVRFLRHAEMRRLAGARPQDEVYGSVIVYNNDTEVYTVEGAPGGAGNGQGQVRATFAPRGKPPASAASAASAAAPALKPSRALNDTAGGSAAK